MKPVYIEECRRYRGEFMWRNVQLQCHGMPVLQEDCLRYDESMMDYWYQVYATNHLYTRHRITFETFLEAPEAILSAVTFSTPLPLPPGEVFYPLLPAQQAVMDKLDLEHVAELEAERAEAELEAMPETACRNGTWHEPLHHHAHPRRPARRMST